MEFTYESYELLLKLLKIHRYIDVGYNDWENEPRCVILRHDIDNSIEKAVELAKIECKNGVRSTYFVLLTSDFYNMYSLKSEQCIHEIMEMGHDIGLHFDEMRYPKITSDIGAIQEKIIFEINSLQKIVKKPIRSVSMHRPSKTILEADLKIPQIVNSYGKTFFKDFKYLSDFRRNWREPVEQIIQSEEYNQLHILTHAFWYNSQQLSLKESISTFLNQSYGDRYKLLENNFTDLQAVVK